MTMLSVDPGIRGTGLALFEQNNKYPKVVTCLTPEHKEPWEKRFHWVCTMFEDFLIRHRPGECYLEQPTFFAQSKEGLHAARSGDLVKLSMLAGALYWLAVANSIEVYTVLPSTWKWRNNKSKTHDKIRSLLPALTKRYNEHEYDAIGIGLFAQHLGRM